jgi:D-arabinitol dehydrogenase (NADP+)
MFPKPSPARCKIPEVNEIQSKKVYKIKNLTDEEATLVEPGSCAIHGLDKLNPQVEIEALIFGAGPTGWHSIKF